MKTWIGIGLAALLCAAWTNGVRAQEKATTLAWQVLTPNTVYTKASAPATPKLEDLPLKGSVSQYGITWTFDKPARVGQFVNGDWYVVGPVTVKSIAPKPLYGNEVPASDLDRYDRQQKEDQWVRNGFMLNPPAAMKVSFDSGVGNFFDPSLIQHLPVAMKSGDSLVSTVSVPAGDPKHKRGDEEDTPIRAAAVLTCVKAPQPPDAFRPSYCDRAGRIYLARDLKRELLPSVAITKDPPKLSSYIGLTQRPWLLTCFWGFGAFENQPTYGADYARRTGVSALLLCTDLRPAQKEPLLISLVQIGIDEAGIIRAGFEGWHAWGGHGSGRKLPLIFAGILLGDNELANVNKSFPKVRFGEDEQTAYGDSWTGAKVVFTGHRGIDEVTGLPYPGTGPYEHKQPKDWTKDDKTSESYRRCCTSLSWIAEALAMKLMHAEKYWNHDAFFDYCDRWMYESDVEPLKVIKRDIDWTPGEWAWQGQVGAQFSESPLVNDMWTQYRPTLAGPTDGWKTQHDDSYLKNAIEKAQR